MDKSTISHEFKRNVTNNGPAGNSYRAETAQELTDQRHAGKPKRRRFTEEKLSPELISGRWEVLGIDIDGVSHETLYQVDLGG